jgi:YNFM family putative membrane transporter
VKTKPTYKKFLVSEQVEKEKLHQPVLVKSTLLKIKIGIFLSGIAVFAQLYLFQPLLPLLCRQYAITPAYSSLAVVAGTIGMAAGLLVFAFYADGFKRKSLMVVSILSASVLTIITSYVVDFEVLIIFNLLKGFMLSGVTAVALAYLSEELAIGSLGVAVALYLSGNTIGGMLGRVLTLWMSGDDDWHLGVRAVGIIGLFTGLVFALVFPKSKHFNPKKVAIRRKWLLMRSYAGDKHLLALNLIGALIMGSFVSVYNYLGFRLESSVFNLEHTVVAGIFLMYIIGVWGSIQAGKWTALGIERYKLCKCILISILGTFMLLSNQLPIVVTGLAFGFFASHTLASKMVSQSVAIGKTTAICLYWLFYYIGSSIIGAWTGVILKQFNWAFFIGILLLLLMCAFIISWKLANIKRDKAILHN